MMKNKFDLYNKVNEYCFIALKSAVLTKILFTYIINKINFLCILYILVMSLSDYGKSVNIT